MSKALPPTAARARFQELAAQVQVELPKVLEFIASRPGQDTIYDDDLGPIYEFIQSMRMIQTDI